MATFRKVVFANEQIYHVYNRGIDRRNVFTDKRELQRAMNTIKYYRFADLPLKLSKFLSLSQEDRTKLNTKILSNKKLVQIIAYCLMPNHFHFLLKQIQQNGIPQFMSNFTNSYTKYFNTKHERTGVLFQGIFKAVIVETDKQFIHLSRYIHLNPTSSFLIEEKSLDNYQWSSLPEYLGLTTENICNKELVLNLFPSVEKYNKFVHDQITYAQELDKIKHLTIE